MGMKAYKQVVGQSLRRNETGMRTSQRNNGRHQNWLKRRMDSGSNCAINQNPIWPSYDNHNSAPDKDHLLGGHCENNYSSKNIRNDKQINKDMDRSNNK